MKISTKVHKKKYRDDVIAKHKDQLEKIDYRQEELTHELDILKMESDFLRRKINHMMETNAVFERAKKEAEAEKKQAQKQPQVAKKIKIG